MPSMDEHESNEIVKMLVCGDSGSGKTGSLASLVDAGLKVRVIDFDNGLSVLKGYVKDKSLLKNVSYITVRDELKLMGARIGIQKAAAFQRAMEALDKGTPFGPDVPPVTKWGSDTVLALDSLSVAGKASLQMVMQANGAGFKAPEIQHYGTAMDNIEKLLDVLTSPEVKCHVLVFTHTYTPEGTTKAVPEALGSKLGPKVPKMFDNMISLSLSQTAQGKVRSFKTKSDGLFACKTAVPLSDTYPIETGLVDIFKGLTGKSDLLA